MSTLTNAQITAGAAVLCDHGQPIGRNAAIEVADAMRLAAPAQQNGKREGFEAAAKALQERAAGHYRNGDHELQDECLQCASMLHDMKPARTPSPQIAEKVELPPLPEKWVNFMRNLANLQPEVYTAHGLLTVTRAFCNTAADLLAAQPAEVSAGQAGQVANSGCIKCPRDPNKRCDYCGYDFSSYRTERAAAPAEQPSAQVKP